MKIEDLIEDLKRIGEGERVSFGEIMAQLQGRSLGVVLTVVALLNLIPFVGILPGVPALTGIVLIVFSLQSLFTDRSSIWLPERWARKTISRDKLASGLDKMKPWFIWLDKIVKARFRFLINRYVTALCAIFLALMFFPLSFIPWGVDVPSIAVLLLGLSLIGRDGVFAALGYGFSVVSLWFVWTYAPVAFETITGWFG